MSGFWTPTIGQRVKIKSIGIKGRVEFIDFPNLTRSYMHPVQIALDEPYDTQKMFRCGIEDLKKLVKKAPEEQPAKKKKKKKEASFDDMDW